LSVPVRTIATAVGKELCFCDGSPAANEQVIARLVTPGGGNVAVIDSTTGSEVLSTNVNEVTGVDGSLSIDLWPTERGDVACYYLIQIAGSQYKVPLPDGVGTLDWNDFLAGRIITDEQDFILVPGPAGEDGTLIYSGTDVPSNALGKTGDFYIRRDSGTVTFYGPKSGGVWPSGVFLNGTRGDDGHDGPFIYPVSGIPDEVVGVTNDYAFSVDTYNLYQKDAISWGSPICNLKGISGDSILSCVGIPSPLLGNDGNFCISLTTSFQPWVMLYGPKTEGVWINPVRLTGLNGTNGTDGTDGVGIPVGGTAAQVLSKIDNTDYNTQWVNQSGGGAASPASKPYLQQTYGGF